MKTLCLASILALLSSAVALAGGGVGDGNRFAMVTYWGEDKVALLDTQGESGKEEVWSIDVLKTAGCAKPYDVRVNSSGDKAFVSCSGNGLIAVVDIVAQQVQFTFPSGQSPRDLQLFNDGKNLIVANSGSNDVTVFDVSQKNSASLVLQFPVEAQPYGVAVVNDGKTALVTGWASGDLHIVDMKIGASPADSSAKQRYVVPVGMLPYTVVAPGDGKTAFVAANSIHSVVAVDVEKGDKLETIKVGNNPWSLAVSPDGNSLIVTNNRSDSLTLLKTGVAPTSTNNENKTIPAGEQIQPNGTSVKRAPKNASITKDGQTAAFTDLANNQVVLVNLKSGLITKVINVGKAPYGIEFIR